MRMRQSGETYRKVSDDNYDDDDDDQYYKMHDCNVKVHSKSTKGMDRREVLVI